MYLSKMTGIRFPVYKILNCCFAKEISRDKHVYVRFSIHNLRIYMYIK